MSLADRIRALRDALPADGAVTLSRATLDAWLGDDTPHNDTHDLSPAEVAERLGKSANTVRRWCASGRLRAYRPGGRDWRVTPAALAELRHPPAPGTPSGSALHAFYPKVSK